MKTVFTVSFFVCMMLIASIAWSEVVYVNGTTGDDATGERGNPDKPFKTIQKGIDVVMAGDTVLVADGAYKGAGNKKLDFKGKAISAFDAALILQYSIGLITKFPVDVGMEGR